MRVITEGKRPIKAWTEGVPLEDAAYQQLINLSNMPFIFSHIAAMPDVHFGKGATIGSVIATKGAIMPAAVGIDIGCGMMATKLPFKIDKLEGLPILRSLIESAVPVGRNSNEGITQRMASWINFIMPNGELISSKHASQIGTLGGGNHFIEICYDQNQDAWIMLHSGSRNIGKTLAEKHIEGAKKLMKGYFIDLPDPDLAYFMQGTSEFKAYIDDLLYAQKFAAGNRAEILTRVYECVSKHVGEVMLSQNTPPFIINCHHNFTQLENHFGSNVWITRKGAVSARDGEWGIIPGSMGTESYIVQGRGNLDSFCSCSHGAGRVMSRNEARKRFTVEDHVEATRGVECRKDADVVDETPSAYKDIRAVMEAQKDLVNVKYILKQVLCIKG